MKRKIVIGFQRYFLNPIAKIAPGLVGTSLIETTGRKSGKPRRQPVGVSERDGVLWIVSEHGRSNYVRNLEADPRVRLRYRGRWRDGTATVQPDEDPRKHTRGLNGAIVRLVGTDLLAIRFDPSDQRI
jgi:deazaflavin-dependent oxidoreductase (nitroreductase family)